MNKIDEASNQAENLEIDELLKECDFMKERLIIENMASDENKTFFDLLKHQLENKIWRSAFNALETKIKSIKALDIEKIRLLICEIDKSNAILSDKDVILFLGPTGSGKSTTIHFLAGSKMIKTKKFGLNHIEPAKNENDPTLLERIKTSPKAVSETQCITAAEIEYRTVGINKKGCICLCDTPGFEDTNGSEVDIANGVTICRVIKNSKSVRPVIIISSKDYEYARMQGLKNLVNILVGMLHNVETYVKSFSFLLTMFSDEQKSDFKKNLDLLVDSIRRNNQNENNDETLKTFFDELKSKVANYGKQLFVDPLAGNSKELLRLLDSVNPISRPSEVFKFSISSQSHASIKEQMRMNQKMINSALRYEDYEFLKFKLNEIKYLKDLLQLDYLNQVYQECTQMIKNTFNEHYKKVKNNFNEILKSEKSLDDKLLNEIHYFIQKGKLIDEIKKQFELTEMVSSEILHQNVSEQCKNLLDEIEIYELDDVKLKANLDKIKIISFHFKEIEYDTKCIDSKIEKMINSYKNCVEQKRYDECAKHVLVIKNAVLLLAEHNNKISELLVSMKNDLNQHFRYLIETEIEMINKDSINVESLSTLLKFLDLAKDAFKKLQDFEEIIDKIRDEFLESIVKYFTQLNEKVINIFKKDFTSAEQIFCEISKIAKLQTINYLIAQTFSSTLEMLCSYMESLKSEINKMIRTNLITKANINELYEFVCRLETSKWIDKYKPGVYSESIDSIKITMNKQLKEMKISLFDIKLDLDNYEYLTLVNSKIENIFHMNILFESYITDSRNTENEVKKWFQDNINRVINRIENIFDLQTQDKKDFLPLCHIKTADNAFKYLKSCENMKILNNMYCQDILFKLETHTKEHAQMIENEINNLYLSITSYSDSNKERLQRECDQLYSRFKELNEINKHFEVSKRFNFNLNLFEKFKKQMLEYLSEQSDEIERLSVTRSVTAAIKKLDIAKGLRKMDDFFENKPFENLYKSIFKMVMDNAPKILDNVKDALTRKDFETLIQIFTELFYLKESVVQYYFGESKKVIKSELSKCFEEIKLKLKVFANSFTDEIFNEIVINLNLIEKFSLLDAFMEKTNDIQNFKKQVKKSLEDIFNEKLLSVENSLKCLNFGNANATMSSIKMKIDILEAFYSENITFKFEKAKNSFKTVLINLQNKYQDKKLEDFLIHPPKIDFEKLEAIDNEIVVKLGQIVIEKFRAGLKEAQNKKLSREMEQSMVKLNRILATLPDNLVLILQRDIDKIKNEIDETTSLLDNAIQNKDLDFISRNINEYKETALKNEYISKISSFIQKESAEYSEKIKRHIENNDMTQTFRCLKNLNDYKNFCRDHLPSKQVEQYNETCINVFNNKIENIVLFLNNCFQKTIEQLHDGSKAKIIKDYLECLITIFIFRKDNEKLVDEILSKFTYDYIKLQKLIQESIVNIQTEYKLAIADMNMSLLKTILDTVKIWGSCAKEIKFVLENSFKNGETGATVLLDDISHLALVKQVEKKIKEIKSYFEGINLINQSTTKQEYERNKFYEELSRKVKIVKEISKLSDHLVNFNVKNFEREIINILLEQRDHLYNNLIRIAGQVKLSLNDYRLFNTYYCNMSCLVDNINFANIGDTSLLQHVADKLFESIDQIVKSIENGELKDAADNLISLKTISDNLVMFKKQIDEKIDYALKNFKKKRRRDGGIAISKLGTILNSDPIGKIIISEHSIFQGFSLAMFNDKIQKHNVDYVLDNITGDSLNLEKLKQRYSEYENIYQKLIQNNLKPNIDLKKFISEIDFRKTDIEVWDASVIDKIPELVAYIFALWTLSNSQHYFENEGIENQDLYLLKPHPAQVISIFRLFGVGDFREVLTNNLCQIGTGEGKSVTLAVASSIFALLGYNVSCACYSEYLSARDYEAFLSMFKLLNVDASITYGTFNKICESIINQGDDLRDRILNLINGNVKKQTKATKCSKHILLIDEVDVFLNKEFYGNIYRPIAVLRNYIKPLIDLIWSKRERQIRFRDIKNSIEYKECSKKYGEWAFLIEEATKLMIQDVKRFDTPAYVVENDRIGYVELDSVSFNTVYGYKTLFAYYFENQKGKISDTSLNENIYLQIKCGDFSYAEIPHQFEYIMGVTGTLKTLSQPEKEIVENVYKIKKKTYIPSVFGKTNLHFVEQTDVFVENSDDYYNKIKREIECRLKGKTPGTERAILVFFESKKALMDFYNSNTFLSIKECAKILTEEDNLTLLEKDKFIKDATRSGSISLITRSFGRGTDFVCRDDIVAANGGVHVLQTFLSEQLSEEVQIKGRTARQGDLGSYSMVLLDKNLETFSIKLEDIEANRANIYQFINQKRNCLFEEQYSSNKEFIEYIKAEHENSLTFLNDLYNENIERIKEFLTKKNKAPEEAILKSRTIVLMDATGSMASLLTQAKNTVGKMFERANQILEENKMDKDCFQLQFACYRDYDCGIEGILQASSWETKPENLRIFMDTIRAYGGEDIPEAIEIGLWHANQENEKEKVSQVILIGDAPAKSRGKIIEYRTKYSGEKNWEKEFGKATHFLDELKKLKDENIPVFAFYLHSNAKNNFEEIAKEAGTLDKCKYLDIHAKTSSENLTNLVTFQILSNIGNNCGKGNSLAEAYMKKFVKGHKSDF